MIEITIYSPLKPLLFKQKVKTNTELKGYFQAKLFHKISGKISYKALIKSSKIEILEQKKDNKNRNWHLHSINKDQGKLLGTLIMESSAKETLNQGHTSFTLTLENEKFTITKELMNYNTKCNVMNTNNEVIASHYPSGLFKRRIDLYQDMSHKQTCAMLLVLSLVVFVA